jgi:hypothetical protein
LRLQALRTATGYARTEDLAAFAAWAGRVEHFLDGLAAAHKLRPRPLFEVASDPVRSDPVRIEDRADTRLGAPS